MTWSILRRAAIVPAAILVASCTSTRADTEPASTTSAGATSAPEAARAPAPAQELAAAPVISVYKSPSCGCCKNWVEHVKAAGFTVEVHDVDNLSDIKADAGVPASARSCHTAIVGGYAIEGHVPAATIQRLLEEKPAIAGIAVPGMPVGSPGMEVPGQPADKYDVVAFKADGSTSVYESH
ncbi:MAG TPA: DUF411 domain-containing protein [Gemmatimonadales bacterium]|nr:DUF411 domain-containing protein [Gemmatimonadales bacterium]